ncbi:MAG: TonB-dependent receptor [Verrucomicrobia bacterium]|nr:TonB-dependent receptor [Verrucomicrobiota bacterium]
MFSISYVVPVTLGLLLASGRLLSAQTNTVTQPQPSSRAAVKMAEVVVKGQREPALTETEAAVAPLTTRNVDISPEAKGRVTDSAGLLRNVPGTAVIRNGPQTGIVQLHGMHNDRVKILVDGMTITPACPNHMDPPLHAINVPNVAAMTVMSGVTPVSLGGDSTAGTVVVKAAPPQFAKDEKLRLFSNITSSYASRDDGWTVGAAGGVANQFLSGSYHGSWVKGGDYRFPGGFVRASGYDSMEHDLLLGFKTGPSIWGLDVGMTRMRNTGTPALGMDIAEDDGKRVGMRNTTELDFGTLESRFYYHHTDHLMDNFSLRPVTGMRMIAPAISRDTGFNIGLTMPCGELHTVRVGTEFHLITHSVYGQMLPSGMIQDTFSDATRNRVGTYAEWQTDWTPEWRTQFGIRNDTVMSDARNIDRFFAANAADRARFNARNHASTDANFDLTASTRFAPDKESAYELGFARKTRSPNILERFLWTPASSSAGQSDGRTYFGNLDLEPEVAHTVSLSGDWRGDKWKAYVSPFYSFVSDYIQGTPIARLDTAGLPVLQFRNMNRVDLYGADAGASYQICEPFAVSAQVSYVRGDNHATGDSPYRIAPLRGVIDFDHKWKRWENQVEVVLVARQGDVAQFNGEQKTPGYALLNLRTGYRFTDWALLTAGIENITDQSYADHLNGINRVAASDVPVGVRLPSPGRFFFVAMNLTF